MKSFPPSIFYMACIASFVFGTIIHQLEFTNNDRNLRSAVVGGMEDEQGQKILMELATAVKQIMEKDGIITRQQLKGNIRGEIGMATTSTNEEEERCKNKLDALEHTWDLRRQGRQNSIDAWAKSKGKGKNLELFDIFEPEAVCLDDERFGTDLEERYGEGRYKAFGDGPKFVCGVDRIIEKAKQTKNCLIYSVGSNNEIDFELSVIKTFGKGNCELHTFDPTIYPDQFIGNDYTTFHDWGFGEDGVETSLEHTRGVFNFTAMSVVTAMKKLGHQEDRTIDIFKIDCEGCEKTALTAAFNAIADGVIKIDQVQVEVHGKYPMAYEDVKNLFEAADRANMRVFHKERNAWGCHGVYCIEYSFVSNDFLRKANAHYMC